jgi:hypothetical protein
MILNPSGGWNMARRSFPRVSLSTAITAALALVLIGQIPLALAEKLDLVCESEKGGSLEYIIDLDQKTVQHPTPSSCTWNIDGRRIVVPDCLPPGRAQITERSISWETTEKTVSGTGVVGSREVKGSLNRLTGVIWVQVGSFIAFEGKCRRATRKF